MILFKLLFFALIVTGGYLYVTTDNQVKNITNTISVSELVASTTSAGEAVKSLIKKNETESIKDIPESKLITGLSHVSQTFNNYDTIS